jgi:hypothetical protein
VNYTQFVARWWNWHPGAARSVIPSDVPLVHCRARAQAVAVSLPRAICLPRFLQILLPNNGDPARRRGNDVTVFVFVSFSPAQRKANGVARIEVEGSAMSPRELIP